jgi:hypothetical protein
MPDALEQFTKETIETLLKNMPVKERLKGLSLDELLAGLSPETRAALAQRLKDDDAKRNPQAKAPDPENEKP